MDEYYQEINSICSHALAGHNIDKDDYELMTKGLETYWERCFTDTAKLREAADKTMAQAIIRAQAACVCKNMDEVAHQIYTMADPEFKSITPFAELEKIAGTTVFAEINKLKQALNNGEGG